MSFLHRRKLLRTEIRNDELHVTLKNVYIVKLGVLHPMYSSSHEPLERLNQPAEQLCIVIIFFLHHPLFCVLTTLIPLNPLQIDINSIFMCAPLICCDTITVCLTASILKKLKACQQSFIFVRRFV